MISRALMILIVISSLQFISTLQLPPKAMAQTPATEGAKVLLDDIIQDLKYNNNTEKAQVHLSILDQQLPRFANSSSIQSVKVLLEDVTSALNSGDVNKAIVHLNLIKQQFVNTTNNAPLMKNSATSRPSTLSNGTTNSMENGYVFVKKWGSNGSGDGQLDFKEGIGVDSPLAGIATDSSGNVYVSDRDNDRIQKFDSNGKFIIKWGSSGDADGQFNRPKGIAIDTVGNVYVTDQGNSRIQKFDSNGNFLTKWGGIYGDADGQFSSPEGIAADSAGNVYVTDGTGYGSGGRIQKFDSNGNFLTKWGSHGTGDGQINWPLGIALDDKTGDVYVAEYGNDKIQKFDSNGNFLTKWGIHGTADGQFYGPAGIAVDSKTGNVYVDDSFNNRIQKFDSNGKFLTKWGSVGSGDGQFNHPNGLAVDSKTGNVYVADFEKNNRIQVFAPSTKITNVQANHPPDAFNQTVVVDNPETRNIELRGNDIDGDPITFSTTSNPTHGQLVSFNPNTGVITYTPNSDYMGEDSFSFQVIDDHSARSITAQVSLVVSPASSSSTETPSESSISPPPSEEPSQQSTGSEETTTPSESSSPPETTAENPPTSSTDYSSICAKVQPVLIPSCSTLVNSDGSLTADGTHAMHCIRNGILLGGGAAALIHLPLSLILKGLSMLAAPTGCDGIVDMKAFDQLGDIGSLSSLTSLLP